MPNWCANTVTIKGPTNKISDLVAAIEAQKDNDDGGVCSAILPTPEHLLEDKSGTFPAWYTWRVNNWGTKWDFYPLEDPSFVVVPDEDCAETQMDFDTAWSPPIQLYDALVEQGFEVTAYYSEPSMMFAGVYENGEDETFDYSDCTSANVDQEVPAAVLDAFGIRDFLAEIEADEEVDFDEDEE